MANGRRSDEAQRQYAAWLRFIQADREHRAAERARVAHGPAPESPMEADWRSYWEPIQAALTWGCTLPEAALEIAPWPAGDLRRLRGECAIAWGKLRGPALQPPMLRALRALGWLRGRWRPYDGEKDGCIRRMRAFGFTTREIAEAVYPRDCDLTLRWADPERGASKVRTRVSRTR